MAFDQTAVLRSAFNALCRHYGHAPAAHAREWQAIADAYAEPHRAYHTFPHIAALLRLFARLDPPAEERAPLIAFALYHDIVYRTDDQAAYRHNEPRSAERGAAFLRRLGAPEATIATLTRRILATQTHDIATAADPWGAFAMDADMGILATAPARYARYAGQIRAEFAHYPDDVFYPARLNGFLVPTLAKGRIFHTEAWRRREGRAFANMRAEIARIGALGFRPA